MRPRHIIKRGVLDETKCCILPSTVAIPGPAIVLIMKSAVLRGRRSAVATAFGVFSGDLVWVSASLAGLTAVLVASRPAFEALRFLGAAYLVYLGVRLMFRRDGHVVESDTPSVAAGTRRSFGEGVASTGGAVVACQDFSGDAVQPHASGYLILRNNAFSSPHHDKRFPEEISCIVRGGGAPGEVVQESTGLAFHQRRDA